MGFGVTYIFYPGGNNAPVTLGDDAVGQRVSVGLPVCTPSTEALAIAGASFKTLIEHGNSLQEFTWQVEYDCGTLDAAVAFKNNHPSSIPASLGLAQGILQELLDDGTTYFFQNCTRPKIEIVNWVGQAVIVKYTVQFGAVTTTLTS